jgi:hypothetical protein
MKRRISMRGFALTAGAVCAMGMWAAPAAVSAAPEDGTVARVGETTSARYQETTVETTRTVEREVTVVQRKVKEKYKCAIFVANRASTKVPDEKVSVMEDLLTGNAADKGFEIISREVVLNSVKELAKAGPNKGNERAPGAQLDEALSNNTSALRLADNMGADYVLFVTISTFGSDKVAVNDPKRNINMVMLTSKMRATYKLLDITRGGSLTAGVATATKSDRVGAETTITRETVVDDLIEATAMDMATMMERASANNRIPDPGVANAKVEFEIRCGVADLVFPEIVKNDQGEYVVTAGRYQLEQLGVAVELDGVLIGTSPGPLLARPGLHKIRLKRAKFEDYEGTVAIAPPTTDRFGDKHPQLLQITMQMTPVGRAEFKEMTAFVDNLKRDKILTDAQAKAWEGYAQQMKQSGNRVTVDVKKNIKYDGKSDTKKDVRQDSKDGAGRDGAREGGRDGGRDGDRPAPKDDARRKVLGDDDERPATPTIRPPTLPNPPGDRD